MSTVLLQFPAGRCPRVVFSRAAFHARVRGSFPGLGCLKETKMTTSVACMHQLGYYLGMSINHRNNGILAIIDNIILMYFTK